MDLNSLIFDSWSHYTLFSGSGKGSIVEPLSAVPLNDELQQARALVAKAEEEVLLTLTEKVSGYIQWKFFSLLLCIYWSYFNLTCSTQIQFDLDDIEKILNTVIQLDVVGICYFSNLSFCQLVFTTIGGTVTKKKKKRYT